MSKDSSGKHYQNNKQRLQKKLLKDILNNKKNLSEDEKQKLVEYRKKIYKMRKL